MTTPLYIAFEGLDGTGKSTQVERLATKIDAYVTRETGGTNIGQQLRNILHDNNNNDLDPLAEALIVAADRRQHIAEVVAPTLASGRNLISDRCVFSTFAYQGYGRNLDLATLIEINTLATDGLMPDIVFLLVTDPDTLNERRRRRHGTDRFESEVDEFWRRVADGYLELAERYSDLFEVIVGGTVDEVGDQIDRKVVEHSAERKPNETINLPPRTDPRP